MLISHEHRFIFIKTRKTAGTSIEISLASLMGPMDVITPVAAEDEAERVLAGDYARNFIAVDAIRPGFRIADREVAFKFAVENGRQYRTRVHFYNHMPARDIRRAVGDGLWRRYHTFAVERIPFDRLLSAYSFKSARDKRVAAMSFSEFIRQDDPDLDNGLLYRWPSGRRMVKTIIPYHDLLGGLERTLGSLGLTFKGPLPYAKSHYRKDRRHWSEIITSEDRAFIEQRCAPDFGALGMTPQEAWSHQAL